MSNKQSLAEVFGFPIDNLSPKAQRYRNNRLCPHNNIVPSCTKDKANDPLGVCSIYDPLGGIAITCPVRFRQDWLIAEDAAGFLFPANATWTSLTEVRLNDRHGVSAGNIDMVLVSYDQDGQILDFGAVEVQAVYISGNVRVPFARFMSDPHTFLSGSNPREKLRPRPDYLSSSRKRLVPQLLYKGAILKSWGKKQAVVLHRGFFKTLPDLVEVDADKADMVWLVYDTERDDENKEYRLRLYRKVYTMFRSSLDQIIVPEPGEVGDFVEHLQEKLNQKLETDTNLPDAPTLDQIL